MVTAIEPRLREQLIDRRHRLEDAATPTEGLVRVISCPLVDRFLLHNGFAENPLARLGS
jgi:hypothetical protein